MTGVSLGGQQLSRDLCADRRSGGALRFAVYEGNTNFAVLTGFCKRLLHGSPTNVYLIVDGHPARRAYGHKGICGLHRRPAEAVLLMHPRNSGRFTTLAGRNTVPASGGSVDRNETTIDYHGPLG
jgi:hypothetical protein